MFYLPGSSPWLRQHYVKDLTPPLSFPLVIRWQSLLPSGGYRGPPVPLYFEWYSRRPSYCCDLSVGEAALELMVWDFHCVFQLFEISLPLFSFAFCK